MYIAHLLNCGKGHSTVVKTDVFLNCKQLSIQKQFVDKVVRG